MNIQNEEQTQNAVDAAIAQFGGIDILVNNASAIDNRGTLDVSMKKYDLMHTINGRGTFLTSKLCLPHLLKSDNAHVLNMSPPLNMDPRWFKIAGVAYTMAKCGTLCLRRVYLFFVGCSRFALPEVYLGSFKSSPLPVAV